MDAKEAGSELQRTCQWLRAIDSVPILFAHADLREQIDFEALTVKTRCPFTGSDQFFSEKR